MVVPASITSIFSAELLTSDVISFVSRADERLLTTDRWSVRAFKIRARLLILFEDGNCATVPEIFELPFIVIEAFNSLSR